MGEFGLVSLPDGTLHSPHHKTIRRRFDRAASIPIPLSEAQKCPYDLSSPPNLVFALICKQKMCWQKGLARTEKKKRRGRNKASKGECGRDESQGGLGVNYHQSCSIKAGIPAGHSCLCSHPGHPKRAGFAPFSKISCALQGCLQHPPSALPLLIEHRETLMGCTDTAGPSSIP